MCSYLFVDESNDEPIAKNWNSGRGRHTLGFDLDVVDGVTALHLKVMIFLFRVFFLPLNNYVVIVILMVLSLLVAASYGVRLTSGSLTSSTVQDEEPTLVAHGVAGHNAMLMGHLNGLFDEVGGGHHGSHGREPGGFTRVISAEVTGAPQDHYSESSWEGKKERTCAH
jgi:hypothetical protein